MDDDFILTLSDQEASVEEDDEPAPQPLPIVSRKRKIEDEVSQKKSKKNRLDADLENLDAEDDGAFAPDFVFGEAGGFTQLDDFDGWGLGDGKEHGEERTDPKAVDIDDIVARRKPAQNSEGGSEGEDDAENSVNEEDLEGGSDDFEGLDDSDGEVEPSDEEHIKKASRITEEDSEIEDDGESIASPVAHPMDLGVDSDSEAEDPGDVLRQKAFFADVEDQKPSKAVKSFLDLSISRPLMKGLTAIGFTEPTPIQEKTIPVALMGKDVVGGAVTGSGKTAAFLLPVFERLLYRNRIPSTRVIIMMPTRELAVQCFSVAKKIAAYTDITFAQIVGGFSLREQEQVLKKRPDVVIATPGRFIDHMRNSPSFVVDTVEILILDEADRMLEDGFADELNEILNTIPKSRQTMLFSATMTEDVDKLIRLGMTRPVRLLVDPKKSTVSGLVQEFIRLRPGREEKRLAYLMWLVENVYSRRTIVFFRQKKEAHRVRVIFALCGFKAAELHGNMSQQQRIEAVEKFRTGAASFLLATDLASRGLDIKGVEAVVNYEAPQSVDIYLHRVGRTARAGRSGRACTLAAEPDRKIVRAAVKTARKSGGKVSSRSIVPEEVDKWHERLEGLEAEITSVLAEEKEERAMTSIDRELKRSENLVVHREEIMSRPKRTWFESEKEKTAAKQKGLVELNGEQATKKKVKKGKKLSGKERKKLELKDERNEKPLWRKTKEQRGARKLPGARGSKAKTKGRR